MTGLFGIELFFFPYLLLNPFRRDLSFSCNDSFPFSVSFLWLDMFFDVMAG